MRVGGHRKRTILLTANTLILKNEGQLTLEPPFFSEHRLWFWSLVGVVSRMWLEIEGGA